MRYLTVEQVLFIHSRLITETGGTHGVRHLGSLQAAVERPKATFEGRDLYPDLFSKAAAMLKSLVSNHPFLDGNKRTGITAIAMFLQMNGRKLSVSNPELVAFTLQVSVSQLGLEEIAEWLRAHTVLI
jgi:death-on-curing protein